MDHEVAEEVERGSCNSGRRMAQCDGGLLQPKQPLTWLLVLSRADVADVLSCVSLGL